MDSGVKFATDVDMSDGIIWERVQHCGQLLELRRAQCGAAAKDFAEELEQVRWVENSSILLCHSLQQDISKYRDEEAEAQERLEQLDTAYGWEVVPEEDFDTVLALHPDNKARGPFILLDKNLDVAAQVRDHIAQSVSLHLDADDRSDDEDEEEDEEEDEDEEEEEDEAEDEAGRLVERTHREQQGEAKRTGEQTEIEDDDEEDLDGEYEIDDDLSW
ncbi:hypothetical protein N0V86_005305 [Didymella sp. IMI 355093]|nr:hypothetical protein N0V86_005305 [Didymella sp. IMI 355093]